MKETAQNAYAMTSIENVKLKSLELHNFKCFDHVVIPFKQITVLCGYNDIGKSCVLDAICFIKQMWEEKSLHKGVLPDQYRYDRIVGKRKAFIEVGMEFEDTSGEKVGFKIRIKRNRKRESDNAIRLVLGSCKVWAGDKEYKPAKHAAPIRFLPQHETNITPKILRYEVVKERVEWELEKFITHTYYLPLIVPLNIPRNETFAYHQKRSLADGSSLIRFLYFKRKEVEGLSKWWESLFGEKIRVTCRKGNVVAKVGDINICELGMAKKRLLLVASLLFCIGDKSVLILEHPDIGLDSVASAALMNIALKLAKQKQLSLIIETSNMHSIATLQEAQKNGYGNVLELVNGWDTL